MRSLDISNISDKRPGNQTFHLNKSYLNHNRSIDNSTGNNLFNVSCYNLDIGQIPFKCIRKFPYAKINDILSKQTNKFDKAAAKYSRSFMKTSFEKLDCSDNLLYFTRNKREIKDNFIDNKYSLLAKHNNIFPFDYNIKKKRFSDKKKPKSNILANKQYI